MESADQRQSAAISLENIPTDIMAIAAKATGAQKPYEMDDAQISQAKDWLKKFKRTSRSSPPGTFPITALTTHWYDQVFGDYQIRQALWTSLQVALEVTAISTVVGTAAAFPLARSGMRLRGPLQVAFTLPMMIPGLLIGVSLLVLFTSVMNLRLSPQTAVIAQSVYTTPFALLIVTSRLQDFDASLERAASDLGANAYARLRYVVLPLIMPAVFAGALFAFTLSLDEYVITAFVIGGQNTLPIYINTQIKFGITPEVNALAAMLLIASLVLFALGTALPALSRRLRRRIRRRGVELGPRVS